MVINQPLLSTSCINVTVRLANVQVADALLRRKIGLLITKGVAKVSPSCINALALSALNQTATHLLMPERQP
jgi:hypothetical protein